MRISGAVNDSSLDGIGLRYVLFVQGCKHNCFNCQNPHTWKMNGGFEVTINSIISEIEADNIVDGVTISGGDPFYQSKECTKLIDKIHKKFGYDVWVYTGFTFEELMKFKCSKKEEEKQMYKMLSKTDVLVDGKFEQKLTSGEHIFRGSSNQRIIDVKKSIEKNSIELYMK